MIELTVTKDVEEKVGIGVHELADLYLLDSIKGFGPQKFRVLHEHRILPAVALGDPEQLPYPGKTGHTLREALRHITLNQVQECRSRAANQISLAHKFETNILSYNHPWYPPSVFRSNNPIPILFAKGNIGILMEPKAIACVGSRNIRQPYEKLEESFVRELIAQGFVIVSGFATGADRIGHEMAFHDRGKTICVMPCGLDSIFPPENRDLAERLNSYPGAVFVSEFGFGIRAAALTLRKRNKTIVAFSQGVLIAQSTTLGGAMNAYRFAREQHKPVATFKSDSSSDASGNEFISAEGASLDAVFPLEPSREAYAEWLQRLSYSI